MISRRSIAKSTAFALLLSVALSSCGATAAVTRRWMNPTMNAVPGSCASSTLPLLDLKEARLYGQRVGFPDSSLLATRAARPGSPDSFTVTVEEGLWDFWLYAFDSLGNQSCRSAIVRLNASQSPTAPLQQ